MHPDPHLHEIMSAHVRGGKLPGLVALVSRRGDTRVDAIGRQSFEGTAPMQRDSLFRITSMTKPITAAVAMILVEEGKLRLDESVDEQWSYLETLRHLVFATDRWVTGPVLRDANPFHPLGMPNPPLDEVTRSKPPQRRLSRRAVDRCACPPT